MKITPARCFSIRAFAHAYYGRGNALRESGQFLFALSDYEKATRYHYPNAAQVHYAEALTYESLKRPNEARKSLERAVAANPKFKQAIDRLATLQGSVMAKPSVVAAVGGGQLTVRKPDLPKAVEPSAALLNEGESDPIMTSAVSTPEPVSKKIVDRVPVEEEKIVAVEVVEDDDARPRLKPPNRPLPRLPNLPLKRLLKWNPLRLPPWRAGACRWRLPPARMAPGQPGRR